MSNEIKFNAIVAICANNNGIGKENDLPWSISEDYSYYQRVVATTRDTNKINAVLLGRLTWESIPVEERPVEPCLNIIISTTMKLSDVKCKKVNHTSSVLICESIEAAKKLIEEKYSNKIESIWCLGGSSLYSESFNSKDFNKLFLTRVFGDIDCDVFIKPSNFLDNFTRLENSQINEETKLYKCEYNLLKKDPKNSLEYIFEIYVKK
jgi:dihydrofolate reductase